MIVRVNQCPVGPGHLNCRRRVKAWDSTARTTRSTSATGRPPSCVRRSTAASPPAVAQFARPGRRAPPRQSANPAAGDSGGLDAAAIRKWARAHGHEVADCGPSSSRFGAQGGPAHRAGHHRPLLRRQASTGTSVPAGLAAAALGVVRGAQCAARPGSPDYAYYRQVADRLGGNRAARSVARKIARRPHHTLRALGDQALAPA